MDKLFKGNLFFVCVCLFKKYLPKVECPDFRAPGLKEELLLPRLPWCEQESSKMALQKEPCATGTGRSPAPQALCQAQALAAERFQGHIDKVSPSKSRETWCCAVTQSLLCSSG